MTEQITACQGARNTLVEKNLTLDDEAYAVRRLAEDFALEVATAKTIARLAGLGDGKAGR